MSCYFRHMKDVLGEAGITVTTANKKDIDQSLHQIAGVPYKECPAAWKKLKEDLSTGSEKRHELAFKLRKAAGG